ncbi:MAG: cysteine synthase family protein [Chloroflexi bacterium]|nr:cysteine synthase family protein [Chloroflexota bacterium]
MLGQSILDGIGKTSLVELTRLSPKRGVHIFAKLEGQNPTGSIKDRVAKYLVQLGEATGELKRGQTIVEASSGNTALALSLVASQKGYRVKAVIPKRATPGMAELLKLYGVEIVWANPQAGMKGAIERAKRIATEEGCYATRQFENTANVLAHYETTGPEILNDLPEVDVFIAGIGTGGTLMGVGRRLKEHNARAKIIGVEPKAGERLQGLRNLEEGYVPPLLDLAMLDGRFTVDSQTAFSTVQMLLAAEGIFAGVSSGAVLHTALRVARRIRRGNIVVIFADGGWKYLASTVWRQKPRSPSKHPDDIAWW